MKRLNTWVDCLHGWTGCTGFLKKQALPNSYPAYPVDPCLRVLLASGEAFEFEIGSGVAFQQFSELLQIPDL